MATKKKGGPTDPPKKKAPQPGQSALSFGVTDSNAHSKTSTQYTLEDLFPSVKTAMSKLSAIENKEANSKRQRAWNADFVDAFSEAWEKNPVTRSKAATGEYSFKDGIKLTQGRYNTGIIPKSMVNDLVKIAKAEGVDPYELMAVLGRESTFGYPEAKRANPDDISKSVAKDKQSLVSGWNLGEQYIPKDPMMFLADKKVPGIEAVRDKMRIIGNPTDVNAAMAYIEKNPKLLEEYKEILKKTPSPDYGEFDPFREVARMIKKGQMGKYNPGDPDYQNKLANEKKLLMAEPELTKYVSETIPKFEKGGMVGNSNDFLWNMINGKIPGQMLDKFKQDYQKRQAQSIASPLPSLSMIPIGATRRPDLGTTSMLPSLPMKGVTSDSPTGLAPMQGMSDIHYTLKQPDQPKQSPIPGALTALGSVGTTMANIGKPNVGLGALSGAATGAGYGAMFGPMGAGIGAAIGGLTGLVGTGLNRSAYEDQRLAAEKGKIKAATVFGTDIGEYERGGQIGGEQGELTPIQTEKGEMIVMPDLNIYRSKSKQTHKQMDKGFITDILPPDAVVASASKKMLISKDKADKMILGYDAIEYTEQGNSSLPKENTLGDIFTKKKMTPAELMNIVKHKFPTTDIELDPFARKANVANLQARMPYINAIMAATKK